MQHIFWYPYNGNSKRREYYQHGHMLVQQRSFFPCYYYRVPSLVHMYIISNYAAFIQLLSHSQTTIFLTGKIPGHLHCNALCKGGLATCQTCMRLNITHPLRILMVHLMFHYQVDLAFVIVMVIASTLNTCSTDQFIEALHVMEYR